MSNKPIMNFYFTDGQGNIDFKDEENSGAAWGKVKNSPFLSGSVRGKDIRFLVFLNKYNTEGLVEWLEEALKWAEAQANSEEGEW